MALDQEARLSTMVFSYMLVSMATVSMALHSMHSEVAINQGVVMYKANGVKFWR